MVILRGNDVTLRWTITRCLDGSEAPEDFSSAELSVVITSYYNRVKVNASVDGNVIIIPMPGNTQQCGKITIEAAWSKNEGKNWSRAKRVDVIEFTDDPNRVTSCGNGADVDVHTIPLKSAMFGSVGHDGLTPEIGDNGNWWIGAVDTNVPATGPQGDAFTFDDFTPAQIVELQKPALDAAESVSQIEQVASGNEQVRVQSEADRRNSEQSRSNNESTRAADELARATSEATRVENESTRILAENQRVSQEQGRGQGEQEREEQELTRVDNETARISNETQRGKDETIRKNNETARVDAESIRSTNEVDRTSKESTRVTNESDRIAAETQRFNSETTRKSAENLRLSEEVTRKNNETGRVSEEAKRTVSETGRVNAEGLRVAAESKRQADTSAAITRTDAAASNATTQAGYAKEQADLAKEAIVPLIPSLNVLYPSVPIYGRINTDAGIVRSKKALNDLTQFLLDLRENTKLLFCPELGVKLRTSGANNYIAKLYDISPMLNDASQTTALNQPLLSGNIAPNEKYALKNPNGGNSYIRHTPISFSATDKWSVSTMINFNGSSDPGANVYYAGQRDNGFGLQVGTNTYIKFRNPINFKDYRYTGHIGKNAIITWSALGNSSISLFINGRLIQTFTGLDTSIIISEIGKGYSSYYNVGTISYHCIRDIALSPIQVKDEYNYLRTLFPEIESVAIGTQTWATSNCEMTCTPQGNAIQEIQAASNVEKISQPVNILSWGTVSGAIKLDDNNYQTSVGGGIRNGVQLKIGTYYKITITHTSTRDLYLRTGNSAAGQIILGLNTNLNVFYYKAPDNSGLYIQNDLDSNNNISYFSFEEVGWSDSTNLYNYIYATTTGTAEQKEYEAVKAAAMWRNVNNDPVLASIYGKKFNKYAKRLLAMDIAYYNAANPTALWGWDIPTQARLTTLASNGGNALKVGGTNYWNTANGINSTGLTLLGGGYIDASGNYVGNKTHEGVWCKDADIARVALDADNSFNAITATTEGYSIRLIKV